jgi:biopolymer transport protein ExbD
MSKVSLFVLLIGVVCLTACESQKSAERQRKTNTTVITITKNGTLSVGHKPVRLHTLVGTLQSMGVAKGAKLAVEGESGADQKQIDEVLETLLDNGFLPKGTID